MHYPDYCKTETQKDIYRELKRLADKNNNVVTIQDFEPFEKASGYTHNQIIETITLFDSKGLFDFAQHAGGDCPIIFSLNRR